MKKQKKSAFTKIILLVLLVMLSLAAAGLIAFWNFLEDYESSLPEKQIDILAVEIENGNYNRILQEVCFTPTDYESADLYKKQYEDLLKGEITYVKIQKESSDTESSYRIKSNGKQIAKVVIKQTGEKSVFGFPLYEIEDIETNEAETTTIEFSAPSNTKVLINNIQIKSTDEVSRNIIEETEYFHGYIENPPVIVKYKVEGLLEKPIITAFSDNGNELTKDKDGNFSLESSDNQEMSNMALEFSLNYSRYIANDGYFELIGKSIQQDLPLYEKLLNYQENWYAWHTEYEFKNKKAYPPVFYTKDCFSVRVTYDHIIYSTETYTFPADNTVFYSKIDGNWMVTDIVMN